MDRTQKAIEILKEIQWSRAGSCPICGIFTTHGHDKHCELAQVLTILESEPAVEPSEAKPLPSNRLMPRSIKDCDRITMDKTIYCNACIDIHNCNYPAKKDIEAIIDRQANIIKKIKDWACVSFNNNLLGFIKELEEGAGESETVN